jgi:hypothetical protein
MLTEVFRFELSDNDWAEFRVYVHPRETAKYVVDTQSGCSCTGYEMPYENELGAEYPLTKAQVRYKFSQWWDQENKGFSGTKIDAIDDLNTSL